MSDWKQEGVPPSITRPAKHWSHILLKLDGLIIGNSVTF